MNPTPIPNANEYNRVIDSLMSEGYEIVPNGNSIDYNWGDYAGMYRQNARTTYMPVRKPDGRWMLYSKNIEDDEENDIDQFGGKRKSRINSRKSYRKTRKTRTKSRKPRKTRKKSRKSYRKTRKTRKTRK